MITRRIKFCINIIVIYLIIIAVILACEHIYNINEENGNTKDKFIIEQTHKDK